MIKSHQNIKKNCTSLYQTVPAYTKLYRHVPKGNAPNCTNALNCTILYQTVPTCTNLLNVHTGKYPINHVYHDTVYHFHVPNRTLALWQGNWRWYGTVWYRLECKILHPNVCYFQFFCCLSTDLPMMNYCWNLSVSFWLTLSLLLPGLTLPPELADRIVTRSKRNMRRALLMCETCKVQQHPLTADQVVDDPDWVVFVRQTALKVLEEQSPKRLLEIRSRLYELLAHCIPAEIIFRSLTDELVKHCDGSIQQKVIQTAASYEHKLQLGSKPIYYLEAFIARFMAMYKGFLQEALMDLDDFDFDDC